MNFQNMIRCRCRLPGPLIVLAAVLGAIVLWGASSSLAAPEVSASIEPQVFSVDQAAELIVSIHNEGRNNSVVPELPAVDGLEIHKRGQSSRYQMVNGHLSSVLATAYQVQAVRAGTYTIPPIAITVDGQQLQTAPLSFEVTTSPATVPPSSHDQKGDLSQTEAGQMAFLRLSPVKEKSYSGELLPLEIKAYFRRGIKANLQNQPRLNGDGFVLALPQAEPTQTEEIIDNVPYAVLTWPASLSAIKGGLYPLSISLEASLFLPAARRSRGPSRSGDPFFDNDLHEMMADLFNQQQLEEKKISLVSREMSLESMPLPETGKPADFKGAIGQFTMQAQAAPTVVGPGDPVTVTMTVAGSGNFDLVDAPLLTRPEGWKSYAPSSKLTPGQFVGQGRKVFEQVIVARNPAKSPGQDSVSAQEMSPSALSFSFSFFDPEKKEYQTLLSPPIPLEMTGAQSSAAGPSPAPPQEPSVAPSEPLTPAALPQPSGQATTADPGAYKLAPQRPRLGGLRLSFTPLVLQTGFQIGVGLIVLLLLAALAFMINNRRLAAHPDRCRQLARKRLLAKQMQGLRQLREQGNSGAFLTASREAIQEQVGSLWQIEPGAITLTDLQQGVSGNKVSSELARRFALAEEGAYSGNPAGRLLSREEMAEYERQLEQELRALS